MLLAVDQALDSLFDTSLMIPMVHTYFVVDHTMYLVRLDNYLSLDFHLADMVHHFLPSGNNSNIEFLKEIIINNRKNKKKVKIEEKF